MADELRDLARHRRVVRGRRVAAAAPRPAEAGDMRRVLTIDGGGVRGVLPASFLATVEEQIGRSPADFFDLIVGTSTGGIIALGLGGGLSASEIRDFYIDRGPTIFRGQRHMRALRQVVVAKHDPRRLQTELENVFGD